MRISALSFDDVALFSSLSWAETEAACLQGLLDKKFPIDMACDLVVKERSNDLIDALSFSLESDYIADKLRDLVEAEDEHEIALSDKLAQPFVDKIAKSGLGLEELKEAVNEVFVELNYPDSMRHLIYYLPSQDSFPVDFHSEEGYLRALRTYLTLK